MTIWQEFKERIRWHREGLIVGLGLYTVAYFTVGKPVAAVAMGVGVIGTAIWKATR